jgi:hypothetical protein
MYNWQNDWQKNGRNDESGRTYGYQNYTSTVDSRVVHLPKNVFCCLKGRGPLKKIKIGRNVFKCLSIDNTHIPPPWSVVILMSRTVPAGGEMGGAYIATIRIIWL